MPFLPPNQQRQSSEGLQQQVFNAVLSSLCQTVLPGVSFFMDLSVCPSVIWFLLGGSVVEWLACWTQAQKGLGSNRSRDAVG